jgi:transposase InsO family protein
MISHTHLIPTVTTIKASDLAWIYIKEIVRLHGIAKSIVSDRDSKFTAAFWKEVQRLLGTRLLMSTAFHPQTDDATEQVNRSIIQILRALIHPDQKDWVRKVPLMEFAVNSSASASTGYATFELSQGYMPQMIQSMPDSELPGVQAFAQQARDSLTQAHDAIIKSWVFQTHQANTRQRDENRHGGKLQPIEVGNMVYLSTDNLNLPKGWTKKLLPKFIGPYKVIAAKPSMSNYTLDLPEDLKH